MTRRELRNRREREDPANEAFSLTGLFASAPSDPVDAERAEPDILFVCTGNICRSALGEVVLAQQLSDLAVRIHSAGTHALVGHAMPEQAQVLASAHDAGTAAAAHRARLLTEAQLRDADLVLTMTAEHSTHALEMHPSALLRVFPVRTLARLSSTMTEQELADAADSAGNAPRSRLRAVIRAAASRRASAPPAAGNEDVIDPYRQSTAVYEQAAEQLIPAVHEIARLVRIACHAPFERLSD